MGKYEKVALLAVKLFHEGTTDCPIEAWEKAASQILDSRSSQRKGCPRNTFLGLCEEGKVRGIPSGSYTKSKKNKEYALDAIQILINMKEDLPSPKILWEMLSSGKTHNQQMDVLLALWKNDLLAR